jgi:hypothetical protein
MKISFRVKKYLKVISLSSRITGWRLLPRQPGYGAELLPGPRPRDTCMMPPPPVITMNPASAILRPNPWPAVSIHPRGLCAGRAEDRDLAMSIMEQKPEGITHFAQGGLNHLHVASVFFIGQASIFDDVGGVLLVVSTALVINEFLIRRFNSTSTGGFSTASNQRPRIEIGR